MQIPKRRSQQLRQTDQEDEVLLTPEAIERLRRELEDLQKRQVKQAAEDVSIAVQKGDLSENAEYQEARARLSRIHARIFSLQDRLKRVVVIQQPSTGAASVQLGCTVTVETGGKKKTYQLVGPHEASPSHGRISHVSPLGLALMGRALNEEIVVEAPQGKIAYKILEIT